MNEGFNNLLNYLTAIEKKVKSAVDKTLLKEFADLPFYKHGDHGAQVRLRRRYRLQALVFQFIFTLPGKELKIAAFAENGVNSHQLHIHSFNLYFPTKIAGGKKGKCACEKQYAFHTNLLLHINQRSQKENINWHAVLSKFRCMQHLYVDNSTIPHTGKGLFTSKRIEKGELVVEYTGEITTWDAVRHDASNAYIYFVTEDYVINAKDTPDAIARYANDARGLTRVKGISNNARFVNIGGRIFIKAKKQIAARCEILVDYGNDYWETVRKNRELQKKERLARM